MPRWSSTARRRCGRSRKWAAERRDAEVQPTSASARSGGTPAPGWGCTRSRCALDAQNVVGAGAADGAGNGIEVVDLLQRQAAADGRRFGCGVARLIVVRICDIHPSPRGVSHNPPYAAQARLGTARSEAAKAISSTNRL